MARAALDSGRAAERFARMVTSQGGPTRLLEEPNTFLPAADVVRPVLSQLDGYVARIDTRAIGMAVVQLGGGRRRATDAIDPAVGLSELARAGQAVDSGFPLAVVHAASEDAWEQAAVTVRSAMTIGRETPLARPVVYTKVTGGAHDEPQ